MLLIPTTRPYAWAAVLVDYGTLTLLLALPRIIAETWSTSRYNLVEEYIGDRGIKTVHLRLFRKGVFAIEQRFRRQAGDFGLIEGGTIGKWERKGDRLTLCRDGQSVEFETVTTIEIEGLQQLVGFADYEGNADLSLADIVLRMRCRRAALPLAVAGEPRH
jgi:hypothetical protein